MKRRPAILLTLLLLAALLLAAPARATRIKDLAALEGVRENQLMGYGLVIGLNGTGDDIKKSVFTKQAIANMVKRMGMGMTADVFRQMKTENVAAVMVTAQLPAFARPGTTIDILVSSIGDATSLSGGTLLMTPLKGPDGNTYAVAQGPLAVAASPSAAGRPRYRRTSPLPGGSPAGPWSSGPWATSCRPRASCSTSCARPISPPPRA